MKKLERFLICGACAALVACSSSETIVTAAPEVDAGRARDGAAAPPPSDSGAAPDDASTPAPQDSRIIPPSELAIDKPFAPGNQIGPYQASLDDGTVIDGSPTMLLEAGAEVTKASWAATTALVPIDSSHKGRRYRIRAKLKTEGAGAAFAWFRIDVPGGQAIDNMLPERAISGSKPFTEVSLVLDVPPKAIRFAFGSGLNGAGRVWIGPITLESVDKTVPVTGD